MLSTWHKSQKKDPCNGCQEVGSELLKCFPHYPHDSLRKQSKCICGMDDSIFPGLFNCIRNCDRFQFPTIHILDLKDPKEIKQTFCYLAGPDSGADSGEDAPSVTIFFSSNHTDGLHNVTYKTTTTQSATTTATTTATKSKNGATALGASFIVLVGIALL